MRPGCEACGRGWDFDRFNRLVQQEVAIAARDNPGGQNPSTAAEATKPNSNPGSTTFLGGIVDSYAIWINGYRWRLMLLIPALAYLALAGGMMFGIAGVAAAALIVGLIATIGQRVPADTWLSIYRAEPLAPGQAQGLRLAVAALSDRAGLAHEPALAIVPSLSVGAFSVGSGPRVAILMTEGLIRRLKLPDLAALAAHEIGHIRAGHLGVFSVADVMVRLAQLLFYAGCLLALANALLWVLGERMFQFSPIVLLLMAPMLNSALQLALPRDMEFAADQTAAFLLGAPALLSSAVRLDELITGEVADDFRLPVPQRRIPLPSPLRCAPNSTTRISMLEAHPPVVLLPPLALEQEPMISLLGFGPVEMRPRNRWPGVWF